MKEEFLKLYAGIAATLSKTELEKVVGRLAAKTLAYKALQMRRKNAGFLLTSIKHAKSIQLNDENDFGKGCHTSSTEPYFFEAAYLHVRDSPIPVNKRGECVVAKEVAVGEDVCDVDKPKKGNSEDIAVSDDAPAQPRKWKCSKHCKPLGEFEVKAILCFRADFDLSVEEVRQALAKCDMGFPNGHYIKVVGSLPLDLRGHPIVCYIDDSCTSTLKILRAASTHFPVLRKFLSHVSDALSAHKIVYEISSALKNGNHQSLITITRLKSLALNSSGSSDTVN